MNEEKELENYLSEFFPISEIKDRKEELLNKIIGVTISQLPENKQSELEELINRGASKEEMSDFLNNSSIDSNSIAQAEIKKMIDKVEEKNNG